MSRPRNPKSWPSAREIRRVVKHLEKLGLSVYGGVYNAATSEESSANMDYDVPTILKYRRDWNTGRLWRADRDEG